MEVIVTIRRKGVAEPETRKAGLSHGYKAAREAAGGDNFAGGMGALMSSIDEALNDADVEHVTVALDKTANEPPQQT